jgi:hypothetical protein
VRWFLQAEYAGPRFPVGIWRVPQTPLALVQVDVTAKARRLTVHPLVADERMVRCWNHAGITHAEDDQPRDRHPFDAAIAGIVEV